jgi:HEAT repeat protein
LADTTALVWDVPADARSVRFASVPIPPAELTAVWKDLASNDAKQAQTAVLRLVQDPSAALPLLEREFGAPRPIVPADVQPLIDQLAAEDFKVRQLAQQQLEAFGDRILPILEARLRDTTDPEIRLRCQELIVKSRIDCPLPASALFHARAVQVLEWIGDARAIALLTKIALGEKQLYLTQSAAAALGRLKELHGNPFPRGTLGTR